MPFNMIEIFQCLLVIFRPQIALPEVHFEPHGLHLVDASVVPTGTEKQIHCFVGLLEHINFGHLFGREGV